MKVMVRILVSCSMLLSTTVFANTVTSVFSTESNLPVYMQETVLKTISTQCPTGISPLGLVEMGTVIKSVQTVDTYESGLVYESHFYSIYEVNNSPKNQEIVVRSFFGRTAQQSGIFSVKLVKAVCP